MSSKVSWVLAWIWQKESYWQEKRNHNSKGSYQYQETVKKIPGNGSYYRIWIPNFGLIAKPLCKALKGPENSPFEWTKEYSRVSESLKTHPASAPALGLPNLLNPCQVYVHERQGIAQGILTQRLSDILQPRWYLSKELGHIVQGWPACRRAVAVTWELSQEAEEFSLGQSIIIYAPHQVLSLLKQKGNLWLNVGRMGKYQAILPKTSPSNFK